MRKSVSTGLSELALVTMLITSVPHYTCRCPNGNVKPFCVSIPFTTNSCCAAADCCAGSSLASESVGTGEPSCCCQTGVKAEGTLQFEGTGCKRAPAEMASFVGTHYQEDVYDLSVDWVLPLNLQLTDGGERYTNAYQFPPPPNLIVSLQHFLI